MSGRIRSVKPEWLEDELLMMCSANARVLSIALILLADDYGNGRAHPAMLRSRSLPLCDPPEFRAAFDELIEIRYVIVYEVSGQQYYSIRNWSKHQKVDKPGKPRVPGPSAQPAPVALPKTAYFIRGEATGLIKIGESIDPVARLAELSRQGPEALHLLAVGGVEREHHEALAKHRVHGEWFTPAPEVLARIREYGGNPDSPIASVGYEGSRRFVRTGTEAPVAKAPGVPANVPVVLAPDLDLDLDHDRDPDPDRGESSEADSTPQPPQLVLVPTEPPADKPDPVSEVFEHWRVVMGKSGTAKLSDKRRRHIEWALREYGRDVAIAAIDGCSRSDFHMGRDRKSGGTAYNDPELIFRDESHVERFLSMTPAHSRAGHAPPSTNHVATSDDEIANYRG